MIPVVVIERYDDQQCTCIPKPFAMKFMTLTRALTVFPSDSIDKSIDSSNSNSPIKFFILVNRYVGISHRLESDVFSLVSAIPATSERPSWEKIPFV